MKIVWSNGCFDVLHVGHVRMLNYAKSLGDRLIVGIDSDERVRASKGAGRPINTQLDRKEMLMNLNCVDDVVIFDSEQELSEAIKDVTPEYIVVGSDYLGKRIIGSEFAKNVCVYERHEPHSTSRIVKGGSH